MGLTFTHSKPAFKPDFLEPFATGAPEYGIGQCVIIVHKSFVREIPLQRCINSGASNPGCLTVFAGQISPADSSSSSLPFSQKIALCQIMLTNTVSNTLLLPPEA